MNYVIIIKATKEFYPDPIYTDLKKIKEKIKYLTEYRLKSELLKPIKYAIEKLNKKRKEQHNKEWTNWCSAID